MKRSEILKLIEETWKNSTSFPTDRLVAEYILKVIEKAGMLPPIIKEKSWIINDNEEMIYSVNEWEPEDDND